MDPVSPPIFHQNLLDPRKPCGPCLSPVSPVDTVFTHNLPNCSHGCHLPPLPQSLMWMLSCPPPTLLLPIFSALWSSADAACTPKPRDHLQILSALPPDPSTGATCYRFPNHSCGSCLPPSSLRCCLSPHPSQSLSQILPTSPISHGSHLLPWSPHRTLILSEPACPSHFLTLPLASSFWFTWYWVPTINAI